MTTNRRLNTTKLRGAVSSSATNFDGTPVPKSLDTAIISRIDVSLIEWITALEVHYENNSVDKVTHGTPRGNIQEIILQPSELIIAIEGSLGDRIYHLTFITNRRRLGPFGERKGEFFRWDAGAKVPPDVAPRMGLLAFRGSTYSNYITSLQATFAEIVQHRPNTVKFERLSTIENAKSPFAVSPLPSFGVYLVSPVIILLVGPEPIKMHVHEGILCRLPFFRAALKGEFKEASEKVIKLPEDDATSVVALIEFLSSGGYTYAYNQDNTWFRDAKSLVPIVDLAQGLFHVSVYATASKYDCPKLVDEAMNNFQAVVEELQGIDVLRLWQEAYGVGLTISAWETSEGPTRFKDGLMKWRELLSEKHREEMEKIMGDYPALACDLLGSSNAGDRE